MFGYIFTVTNKILKQIPNTVAPVGTCKFKPTFIPINRHERQHFDTQEQKQTNNLFLDIRSARIPVGFKSLGRLLPSRTTPLEHPGITAGRLHSVNESFET